VSEQQTERAESAETQQAEAHGEIAAAPEEEERDADAALRRRMAVAQVRQWGDPVLRLRAHPVERFDDDLDRLTRRMGELMHDARGIGLAATQVGILQRLFVFQAEDHDEPVVVCNPVVTPVGDGLETDDEGCLSLQGVMVPVERPDAVVLEGQDIKGAAFRMELVGLDARVVQHELDHLDGVLILDRTDRESRRDALKSLRPKPSLD
jgi:peptide deformylase